MKAILRTLKRFVLKTLAYFPTALPVGMTRFNAWSAQLIDLYDLPNNDTSKWVLACMVINLEGTKKTPAYYVPNRYFGLAARKAMANEVAGAVMRDIKDKQDAERKAATKSAEATAPTLSVVSDVQQPVQN